MSYLPELFESKDYATTIKVLDSMAGEAVGPALASLLCNRALCYQKMDLHRKALKNYDEALKAHPSFARAHMGRGRALAALGRPKEAQAAWKAAIEGFSPADDLQLTEDAFRFIDDPQASIAQPHSAPPLPPQPDTPAQPHPSGPQPVANGAGPKPAAPQPQPSASSAAPQAKPKPMPDTATAVAIAVGHINGGRIEEALSLLDQIIASSQTPNMGALVARGTARALKRDLKGAVADFTGSINIYPQYGDAWKRRGQARSADGDREGALVDFKRAAELMPDPKAKAEVLLERAMVLKSGRDLRRAAAELEQVVRLDGRSPMAWLQLGMCRTGLGDIEVACAAYKKAISFEPNNLEAWFHCAQARKEAAHVAEAEAAFKEVFRLAKPDGSSSHMFRVYAHMKQGMGEHQTAISVLDKALEGAPASSQIECLFLRGACQHALGYHQKAVKDYTQAFLIHEEGLPEEARQLQVLAFFQKELAGYARGRLDDAVASFSMDHDIAPLFKELWCKKMPPTQSQLPACQLPIRAGGSPRGGPPQTPDPALTQRLAAAADALGALLQNRHQGFLPNARQQRMGGLAALELAQTVRQLVAARREGRTVTVREGATVSKQAHPFGWRDAMDIVVKWRQLSEPNDQVIWVDLLTRSEFETGFGSHTPMFSGQTKCVRYYMNFSRALALLKEILLKEQKAFDGNSVPIPLGGEETQDAIRKADTAEAIWNAIGKDGWAVVPIASCLRPGGTLEGTRLTIVKIQDQPDSYEMSIRTPVTPPRWAQFDEELEAVWEKLLDAMVAGDKPAIAVSALTYAYYWYNFMPLARGTAVSGYITLLALFLAAEMPITTAIPKDYQVDWEAILQRTPQDFIASLSPWFLPEEARPSAESPGGAPEPSGDPAGASASGRQDDRGPTEETSKAPAGANGPRQPSSGSGEKSKRMLELCLEQPAVNELIPSLRNRLEILNGPNLPRI